MFDAAMLRCIEVDGTPTTRHACSQILISDHDPEMICSHFETVFDPYLLELDRLDSR